MVALHFKEAVLCPGLNFTCYNPRTPPQDAVRKMIKKMKSECLSDVHYLRATVSQTTVINLGKLPQEYSIKDCPTISHAEFNPATTVFFLTGGTCNEASKQVFKTLTSKKQKKAVQRKFWMSHLGKFWVLSLGKLWIFPQCSWWEHPGHMTWDTANVLAISWPRHTAVTLTGNILNELLRKILNFCKMFLMGTPWSHDLEHCECTDHFLTQEHCRETGWQHSKWTWDVLGGFLPSTLSMSLWCPCDVPAQATTPCSQCKMVTVGMPSRNSRQNKLQMHQHWIAKISHKGHWPQKTGL